MSDDPKRAVSGDFHVIRMDGLFHVVFRPDSDPEWFRIIASFYTYERAWSYCDIERVSVWIYKDADGDEYQESETGEEEVAGLRMPPIEPIPEGWMAAKDGTAEMVRHICPEASEAVPPHPEEDFSDHPLEGESPKDFHLRSFEEGMARQNGAVTIVPVAAAEDEDPMAEAVSELSNSQWSVLKFFRDHADEKRLVSASGKKIAEEAGVPKSASLFLVEALVAKGFLEVVDRGGPTQAATYKLLNAEEKAAAGDRLRCSTCGGPRAIGSVSQCKKCYQGEPVHA